MDKIYLVVQTHCNEPEAWSWAVSIHNDSFTAHLKAIELELKYLEENNINDAPDESWNVEEWEVNP